MINDTIRKIESRIRTGAALPPENRAELLALVEELRKELATLPSAHAEHAESISGFADASTREAMRTSRDPQLVALSVEGLSRSVREVETSHPRLVEVVNSICHMLSNLGI